MTGYTVHTGSSEKFSSGWDRIFSNDSGKGKKTKQQSAGKKSTKKKATAKAASKSTKKRTKKAKK